MSLKIPKMIKNIIFLFNNLFYFPKKSKKKFLKYFLPILGPRVRGKRGRLPRRRLRSGRGGGGDRGPQAEPEGGEVPHCQGGRVRLKRQGHGDASGRQVVRGLWIQGIRGKFRKNPFPFIVSNFREKNKFSFSFAHFSAFLFVDTIIQ